MTAAGEALPPLYIISSSAKDEANFRLDPSICEGLPTVKAKYAGDTYRDPSSFIVVRHTGSMDTPLWHDLNRHIYLPCFEGKISKEPVRDPITQKLKSGPLIVKTDAGPGRLSDKDGSLEFRAVMAEKGVHILLSLPNGPACTAEMDQIFEKYGNNLKIIVGKNEI